MEPEPEPEPLFGRLRLLLLLLLLLYSTVKIAIFTGTEGNLNFDCILFFKDLKVTDLKINCSKIVTDLKSNNYQKLLLNKKI